MTGLITQTLKKYYAKGKSLAIIKRYLSMKHKITVSSEVLTKRLKYLNFNTKKTNND